MTSGVGYEPGPGIDSGLGTGIASGVGSGVVSPPPSVDASIGPQQVDGGIVVTPFDGGPPSTSVPCGTATCNNTTQECCYSAGGAGSCVAVGMCRGLSLTCTSSVNCVTGDVCCAQLGGGGGGASCQPTCPGAGGPGGGYQLCATSSECPAGETCRQTPFGVSACRPPRGGSGSGSGTFFGSGSGTFFGSGSGTFFGSGSGTFLGSGSGTLFGSGTGSSVGSGSASGSGSGS